VWEWCWDWDGAYTGEDQTDPKGASSGDYRVYRGGSWPFYDYYVRSASRDKITPPYRRYSYNGFRLVRP